MTDTTITIVGNLIAATLPITDWPGLNEGEARS